MVDSETLTLTLKNELSEIVRVAEAVETFGEAHHWPTPWIFNTNLVLDELITNCIRYGGLEKADDPTIRIVMAVKEGCLTIVLEDPGIPFNPFEEAAVPDLEMALEDRPIGGLGVHLVKKLMSEVDYQRVDHVNRVLLVQGPVEETPIVSPPPSEAMSVSPVDLSEARFDTAYLADTALRNWYLDAGEPEVDKLNWQDYDSMALAIQSSFKQTPATHHFQYLHPVHLQIPGAGKAYPVRISYADTETTAEPVIAIGGLMNSKHRFDFLAIDALSHLRTIAIDLCGRGESGWLVEQSDYHLDTYVEMIVQFMDHLSLPCCTLLGSSLGGSIALRLAASYPDRVARIILNDSGPYIPQERRQRRSKSISRHYVFDSPVQMFRRMAIAGQHSGPTSDAVLLHNNHHKTRWSAEENGRIYRHDLRAMLAYREEATQPLDLWQDWEKLHCPVLLIHGTNSDAMLDQTIERMRLHPGLSVLHVHDTGHTPTLSNGLLNRKIVMWVLDDCPYKEDLYFQIEDRPSRMLFPDVNP